MPSPAPIFNPTPEVADAVIEALGSPDETLRHVAESYGTTLEALTLWMAREDVAERLNHIESAVARRTRLIATNYLPSVVTTLNRIIDEYNDEESHVPIQPNSLMGHEYRRRSRESARRAASLLLRLARFRSSPSGGGGSRSEPEGDARQPHGSIARSSEHVGNLRQPRAPRPPARTLKEFLSPVPQAVAPEGDCLCESTDAPRPARPLNRTPSAPGSRPDHPCCTDLITSGSPRISDAAEFSLALASISPRSFSLPATLAARSGLAHSFSPSRAPP